jgi:hypothetical protein
VLAADTFPYLVAAGPELAARHVQEAARVPRPGGYSVIFNYSYRVDEARDAADVARAAARNGFAVRCAAPADFALWDARVYLLQRLGDGGNKKRTIR